MTWKVDVSISLFRRHITVKGFRFRSVFVSRQGLGCDCLMCLLGLGFSVMGFGARTGLVFWHFWLQALKVGDHFAQA